ncbi:MAG: thiamine-phosphate kinase [Rikenellaceae bacterium]|nr:thiamine-phosphate kinase [Rikenellaceae bacterium]MDE7355714.1 thiamine-phosphate kinase [Rikenellaceae bacterium]
MRMNISSLGEFGFIDRITDGITSTRECTIKGVGDDAAVIAGYADSYKLISSDMFLEGIAFDLTYTPLKHLGFKCVVAAASDIVAMNGTAEQITFSIGLSQKITLEMAEELYDGVRVACDKYSIDLVGGDTTPSMTGMAISVTAVGSVSKDKITYRNGAKNADLLCVTGDLGAAFMGLKLLEREKRVLNGNAGVAPKFDGYEYLLERQLHPLLRSDVIEALDKSGIVPTSMIDISDGLASEVLHLCRHSGLGARLYLSKIPISSKCFELGDEMNIDPVMAALNGGDDYELLFTVPVDRYEDVLRVGGIDVIGHMTAPDKGAMLVTPDGAEIALTAQGWSSQE